MVAIFTIPAGFAVFAPGAGGRRGTIITTLPGKHPILLKEVIVPVAGCYGSNRQNQETGHKNLPFHNPVIYKC